MSAVRARVRPRAWRRFGAASFGVASFDAVSFAALASAAVLGGTLGCEVVTGDGARLSELSRDEFMGLCDELRDATPGPDVPVTCSDGWQATVLSPSNEVCSGLYLEQCSATAGDMRACAEATRRDPCAAIDAPPPECAPFYASTCLPWITASPVIAECPSAAPEALRALEGIYETIRHTRRTGSCQAEEELVLDAEPLVVVVATENIFGEPIGLVQSCATAEACRAAASLMLANEEPPGEGPELDAGFGCVEGTPLALSGHLITVPGSESECRMIDTKTVITRADDGSLRIDQETWDSRRPTDPNGCGVSTEDRRTSAGDCTGAEAREARFVEAL